MSGVYFTWLEEKKKWMSYKNLNSEYTIHKFWKNCRLEFESSILCFHATYNNMCLARWMSLCFCLYHTLFITHTSSFLSPSLSLILIYSISFFLSLILYYSFVLSIFITQSHYTCSRYSQPFCLYYSLSLPNYLSLYLFFSHSLHHPSVPPPLLSSPPPLSTHLHYHSLSRTQPYISISAFFFHPGRGSLLVTSSPVFFLPSQHSTWHPIPFLLTFTLHFLLPHSPPLSVFLFPYHSPL